MEAKFLQHQKLAIITIIGQPLPPLLIIIMQKKINVIIFGGEYTTATK
jgi:hypothetical protein